MDPIENCVSACLIVRNEALFLETCLKSIRKVVDEIVIVDTGSVDNTVEIAERYADKVIEDVGCNDSEGRIIDFSMAREQSFKLASCPWKLWIDGDDELVGSERLKELLRASDEMDGLPTLVVLPYEYSHDPATGKPNCVLHRERIMKPWVSFSWAYPVHEIVLPAPGVQHVKRLSSEIVKIVHQPGRRTKSMEKGRNLRILKAWQDKHGDSDPRQMYYLGIEYGNEGLLDESIETLKRYVSIAGWDDEKCLACLKIAEHYSAQHRYEDQLTWAMKAQTVCESWGETYFMAARALFNIALANKAVGTGGTRNWERVVHYVQLGLSKPPTKTLLFVNPMERTIDAHRLLSMALIEIGDFDGALRSLKEVLNESPADAVAIGNRPILEKMAGRQMIHDGLMRLIQSGALTNVQGVRVMNELDSLIG